jgi:hypothetical protein
MMDWGNTMVRCLVLDPSSIRIATEFVHLAKGCLGLVNQFALQTGVPHFCHIEDVGKLVSFVLPCGLRIDRRLVVTWPENRNARRSDRGDGDKELDGSTVEEDDGVGVEDDDEDESADEDDGCRRVEGAGETGEAGEAEEEDGDEQDKVSDEESSEER